MPYHLWSTADARIGEVLDYEYRVRGKGFTSLQIGAGAAAPRAATWDAHAPLGRGSRTGFASSSDARVDHIASRALIGSFKSLISLSSRQHEYGR
jgi:hypothetical protein